MEENKALLEEILKTTKENQEKINKVLSFQKWSQITRVFYWLILIGVSVGAFYFTKPYLNSLLSVYSGGLGGGIETKIQGGMDMKVVEELLKTLQQ